MTIDIRSKVHEYRDCGRIDEAQWVDSLIDEFAAERLKWSSACTDYVDSCLPFNVYVVRLALGAFLHISYDLPRVIAGHWRQHDSLAVRRGYATKLTEEQATAVFFDLHPLFENSFREVARSYGVTGLLAAALEFVPDDAFGALTQWSLHLRTAAWIQARALHLAGNDARRREGRMLRAMVDALDDVKRHRPWTALRNPPNNDALRSALLAGPIAAEPTSNSRLPLPWVIAGSVLVIVVVVLVLRMRGPGRRLERLGRDRIAQEQEAYEFINELGKQLLRRMLQAAHDADGVDRGEGSF